MVEIRNQLLKETEMINEITFIGKQLEVSNADSLRKICVDLKNEISGKYILCLTANIDGKAHVAISIEENLAKEKTISAVEIIKEKIAPMIKGGGGGNATLANAGGQDAGKLKEVIEVMKEIIPQL